MRQSPALEDEHSMLILHDVAAILNFAGCVSALDLMRLEMPLARRPGNALTLHFQAERTRSYVRYSLARAHEANYSDCRLLR